MTEVVNLSRRGFLRAGALSGGGLILGVYLPTPGEAAEPPLAKPASFKPNAFLRIGSDNSVTVIVNHSEMGQGIYSGLAMIVAEELDADWTKVKVEAAPADPVYNHTMYGVQITGGSTSTISEWDRLRKAGATARAMLITAAAQAWKVAPGSCRANKSRVIHQESGIVLSYGELAEPASRLVPVRNVPLKDPANFTLIGTPVKRLDTPDKVTGAAVFGLDVTVPGMLVAVLARPPVFGGKAIRVNSAKALAVSGVRRVVEIDRGVAVVADGFWQARKGRAKLEIDWDLGDLSALDSHMQRDEYVELSRSPGAVARKQGDAEAALAASARVLESVLDLPYLAHAPMEPLNCVADVRPDGCDVWTGTQAQTLDHHAAALAAGLKPEQVKIHTTLLGGGFGRRAALDSHFVREAVLVSKAVKAPVKVIWTREDDLKGGYYRPAAHHVISAGLSEDGQITAWKHRIVCQSFIIGTPFEAAIVKDGVDETCVEGAADLPYEIPNILVDWKKAPSGVPVQWLRSVGHTHTAFVVETFLDELAHAAGKDPLELRRSLLAKHPRHLRVLDRAAQEFGWDKPLRDGRGRGLAVHQSFGSYVAHVVEISVSKTGKITVHRVVCAIDCGPIVNPDSIRAQMEGCIVFGLSTLHHEITFTDGRVKQRNFHDYPVLRMNETPEIEVHIVKSTDSMGGVGEPGVPPVAPAVANAVFNLTGKRIRRLPFRADDLKQA